MTTQFPFTISTEFPYLKVATDRLKKEILDNENILTALADVSTGNGVCYVTFRADLSAAEETELYGDVSPAAVGSIIGDHSGEPLEVSAALDSEGVALNKAQPQPVGHEMCDRDFKIVTCKVTQADAVEDLQVNVVTLHEVAWQGPELKLVGVYKDAPTPTDPRVLCADQADADLNGILSVWDYCAFDQADGTTMIEYDMRQGALVHDPAIPAGERFAHRVYMVMAPATGQPNYVRTFDGYACGRPQEGELSTDSPVAKSLPLTVPGVTNVVRIYVFHPKGQSNEHVLWLMTYRPTGTF